MTIWKYKDKISQIINKEGSNFKDVNWVKICQYGNEQVAWGVHAKQATTITIEVGYWIRYNDCKPIYQKQNITLKISDLRGK